MVLAGNGNFSVSPPTVKHTFWGRHPQGAVFSVFDWCFVFGLHFSVFGPVLSAGRGNLAPASRCMDMSRMLSLQLHSVF